MLLVGFSSRQSQFMTRRKAKHTRWIPSLAFLACLVVAMNVDTLLASIAGDAAAGTLPFWRLTTETLAWIFGAAVFNQVSRWLLFDKIVARAIGGPVPGVLKEIAAVLVYLVAITCIAGLVFDRSVTGFLAAVGAGGVVLGFALRNLFADVFTGLAINIDHTFQIGDWVQINEGLAEPVIAQIREIGWRCTSLTTEEQTTVVVPNGMLGVERLINISQPIEPTRYEVEVTVEYAVPSRRVKRVLLAALESLDEEPGFDTSHSPAVLIGGTSSTGVEYILRFWILPWHPVSPTVQRDRVLTTVLHHLQLAGIALAYPKTDIYHARMPERQVDGHTAAGEINLLSRVHLFEPLSDEELKYVVESLQRRVVRADTELVREGEKGDSLFVLIEGLLAVEVEQNGEARRVAMLEPGQFFGEMSLLTGERRSATVRTVTESVVYEIDKQPIARCMHQRPELADELSRKLAKRELLTRQVLSRVEQEDAVRELDTFARQLLERMREFLFSGRPRASESAKSSSI
jgi:small-conductance mechanosensitive channel/CRP-like cAMP-binding protein